MVTVTRLGRSRRYALRDRYVSALLDGTLSHIAILDGAVAPDQPAAPALGLASS